MPELPLGIFLFIIVWFRIDLYSAKGLITLLRFFLVLVLFGDLTVQELQKAREFYENWFYTSRTVRRAAALSQAGNYPMPMRPDNTPLRMRIEAWVLGVWVDPMEVSND